MYRASSIVGEVKGQGQGWAKGQIHLISYNSAFNCHRDFKLGSCFSLWKAATNMTLTLTLKSSPTFQIFETYQLMKTSQTCLDIMHRVSSIVGEVKGQGRAKGQIHLISCNVASNCHRDFILGSCFRLWKTAPNMTLTLTLKSSPKVQIFETSIKEN